MSVTGALHDIDLAAPQARTRATLLSVARPIPLSELTRGGVNRMLAGVTWLPWPDIVFDGTAADCETVPDFDATRDLHGLEGQNAFMLWDSIRCAANGRNIGLLAEFLGTNFTDFISAGLAAELETGDLSGGISLTGDGENPPTIVEASAVDLATAIASLETYLATDSGKPGMIGVIHLTPALLVLAEAATLIHRVGDGYQTSTGHRVIADAGHTGAVTPYGGTAANAGEAWIYATGDVWYALSGLDGVFREIEDGAPGAWKADRNENAPIAQRYGLLLFDPNVLAAAKVTVALPGGSGGGGGGGGGDASAANQTAQIAQINTLLTNLGDADVNLEALEALMTTLNSQTNDLEAPLATLAGTVASGSVSVQPTKTTERPKATAVGLTNAAYAIDEQLGTEITFANAARSSGWGGVLNSVVVVDDEKRIQAATASFDLYIFDSAAGGATDNNPFDDSDTDMHKLVAIVSFSPADLKTHTSNAVYRKENLGILYTCDGGTSLFGILVTRAALGTGFTSATAIHVTLGLVRD